MEQIDNSKQIALMYKIRDINTQFARSNQLVYAKLYHPIRGKQIDFKTFPYLIDIYEDKSKEIAVQKSGQCGISEWAIDKSFHFTENNNLVGLYCFPAQAQLNAFSHARVESVIKHSSHLSSISGDTNNVSLRELGSSHIYFRGMQDMKQIVSVDADYLVLDELDLMRQDYIPVVEKRLGGSVHKYKIYISTPSYPNHGINLKYKEGDMREWFIKCEHCNHLQYLDFFKNVDLKKEIYICKKCGKQINNLQHGRWVPRYKDRALHSYHISKLFSPRCTIKELKKAFKNKAELQHFYNFDLGLPYVTQGSRLQKVNLDVIVEKSNYDIVYSGNGCCMGVDIGAQINIYITEIEEGVPKTLFAGTVSKFEELDRFMNIYNVEICVIDALPETRESKKFAKRFPGRVFLAYYPNMKMDLYYHKDERDDTNIVDINRTLSLDYMFNEFFMQKIKLPRNIETVEDFCDQMTTLVRVIEGDNKGNKTPRYVEQGADHYAHARNYCRVAEAMIMESESEMILSFPTARRDRHFTGGIKRVI